MNYVGGAWICAACGAFRKGPRRQDGERLFPPCVRCGDDKRPDPQFDEDDTYAEDPLGGSWS